MYLISQMSWCIHYSDSNNS